MCFAVGGNQSACWGEDEGGVVIFIAFWDEFGNAAADYIGLCFGG